MSYICGEDKSTVIGILGVFVCAEGSVELRGRISLSEWTEREEKKDR